MTATADGRLLFGDLERSAVYAYADEGGDGGDVGDARRELVADTAAMQWPDTFAWWRKTHLVFSSNRLHLFFAGTMRFDDARVINMRLWDVDMRNTTSYLSGSPQPPSAKCLPQQP
mmetsp:Transcript_17456/g.42904  ORF Transcript_17456/g.42904 Transcript_17456/m.42904 type:complete len:116 (-) Transcript_17456:417-764(-)